MSSTALASLTATYTDSEGEEGNEENEEAQGTVTINTPTGTPDNKSSSTSRPSSPIPAKVTSKVKKLVSYHDDTIVSDEEGENNENNINIDEDSNDSNVVVEQKEVVLEEGIELPPEPLGHCSTELQEKILRLHEKMQNNALDMNAVIQQRKDFRNPSIYEKLIQFCSINELGTNYPADIYDPLKWGKESFYEDLAKVQKTEMEKREKERKSKVEVMSGTKKIEEDSKKRKSKWDQPGGNTLNSQSIKPAGLVQPSLTNSATGTKSTVISAFGSLPKKPRP
ncbi:SAP30-binding protein [Agrilus planipennis]|uniref:SAP30-binding protein n=1 Tax=Agrilus planipennis TaxID=224129 RepID=A0A1W4XTK5_AGRPL|nr:SAP30-binding protein [Agrilus planipennis]